MAGNVKVSCRFRPTNEYEKKQEDHEEACCIRVSADGRLVSLFSPGSSEASDYAFDQVFDSSASQEAVFRSIGRPLVEDTLAGYNCTLFAYGQTGSGKTYTVLGKVEDSELQGLVPRIVGALFVGLKEETTRQQLKYELRVSYLEVYLEKVRDLLKPCNKTMRVREDPDKGVWVEGAQTFACCTEEEVLQAMALGIGNRATGATQMNQESSRSHSILSISVTMSFVASQVKKTAKLFLVDLAGSEMVRKTNASGQRLEEAKHINKSLTALGMVITALTDGSKHIPYRDSKLTRILQDSLGGNAKTHLVVTCSPSPCNYEETLSSLRFGTRAKRIRNRPRVNEEKTLREYKQLLASMEQRMDSLLAYISTLEEQQGSISSLSHSIDPSSPLGAIQASTQCGCRKEMTNAAVQVDEYELCPHQTNGEEFTIREQIIAKENPSRPSSGVSLNNLAGPTEKGENDINGAVCSFCSKRVRGEESDKGQSVFLCDGNCGRYFHPDCLGLLCAPEDGEWYCSDCRKAIERADVEEYTPPTLATGSFPLKNSPRGHSEVTIREQIEILRTELLEAKRQKETVEAKRAIEEELYRSMDKVGADARKELVEEIARTEVEMAELKEKLTLSESQRIALEREQVELKSKVLSVPVSSSCSCGGSSSEAELKEELTRKMLADAEERLSGLAYEFVANREALEEERRKTRAQDIALQKVRADLVKAQEEISQLRNQGKGHIIMEEGHTLELIEPQRSSTGFAGGRMKLSEGRNAIDAWWRGEAGRPTADKQASSLEKELGEDPQGPEIEEAAEQENGTLRHKPSISASFSSQCRKNTASLSFKQRLEGLLWSIEAETGAYKCLKERTAAELQMRRDRREQQRAIITTVNSQA